MKNILITGGSGNIGSSLSEKLTAKGHHVRHLSREKKDQTKFPTYLWDVEKGLIDDEAIKNLDAVIHLAGASITEKKWSEDQKNKILDSRVEGTKLLFEKISQLEKKPTCFISASGTGYYGNAIQSNPFEESDAPGKDYFLAEVCKKWEEETTKFNSLAIRTVELRTPVVLTREGHALDEIKKVIKAYMGTALGSGKQYLPWIHIEDLVNMYIKALEDESWKGPYNAVAPEIATNEEFMKTFAKVLDRPTLPFNAPSSILKLSFGEMIEVLLGGSPVSSKKAISGGFTFKYPELEKALESIWGEKK